MWSYRLEHERIHPRVQVRPDRSAGFLCVARQEKHRAEGRVANADPPRRNAAQRVPQCGHRVRRVEDHTVGDFTAGAGVADVLNILMGAAYDTFAEVMAVTQQVGSNTVITFDANTSITLAGVNKAALVADDFKFV